MNQSQNPEVRKSETGKLKSAAGMFPVCGFRFLTSVFLISVFSLLASVPAAQAACAGPAGSDGDIMYNKDNHVLQFCDGNAWNPMGNAWTGADGGGCTAPAGSAGQIIYNHDYCVPQYCDSAQWTSIGHPHARDCNNTCGNAVVNSCTGVCGGAWTVGAVCTDGSVYAGLSTDGNVNMYTQRCDIGMSWNGSACTGTRTSIVWSAGNTIATGITNADTGKANTAALYPLSNADSPYTAAITCHNLNEDGHTDWYLPAVNEMNVLNAGQMAIGNFTNVFPTYYWISTEYNNNYAWEMFFGLPGGGASEIYKYSALMVRCVRR